MIEQNVITREGLKELQDEMKRLVLVERPKVIQEIKEAREQGDLSENAEFDAARQKQGQIEDRIKEIERIIADSKVATSRKTSNQVTVGSKIIIENLDTGKENEYILVGTREADPFQSKVSNISPLGIAILNKSEGEEISYNVEIKGKTKKQNVRIKKVMN